MEESKDLHKASEYIRQATATIAKAEKIILLSIILTAVNIAIALLRLTKRL